MMPLGGLLTVIFLGYILKKDSFKEEYTRGSIFAFTFPIWLFFVRVIAPLGIITIILQDAGIIDLTTLFGSK